MAAATSSIPPGPACWRCRSTDVAPEPVSGRATVAAYTVNRQNWIPGFEPPYIVAMVELAEEPDTRLISNVVDVAPDEISVGMAVEVFFEDWTALSGEEDSRVWLPLFRPVKTTESTTTARCQGDAADNVTVNCQTVDEDAT